MKFQFRNSGFVKEVTFVMITLTIYIFEGIGRSYIVFLFKQLKLPDSPITLNEVQESWIASAFGFLSPIGCLLSGTVMDMFGRKSYFFIMYIPLIISWLMIAFASNYEMLFYGMIIQGFGIGMSFCASTYISEISTTQNRGAYLGLIQIAYCVGILICNVSMYYLNWDVVAIVYAALAIISTLLMLILIESPTWLYSKGRIEKSIEALSSLRCSHPDDMRDEIEDMEKSRDSSIKLSLRETLKNVLRAWKPLLMSVLIKLLLQNSGYSIMSSYTITVFDQLKLPLDSSRFTIEYSVAGFVGSIATAFFMHTLNRKTLLFSTSFVMGICMVVVGIYEEIFYFDSDKIFAYIVPIAFYVNTFANNLGAEPIIFCLGGELFPNEARGILNGIYGAVDNLYMSASMKVFPNFINAVGVKLVIWTFALFSFKVLPLVSGKM